MDRAKSVKTFLMAFFENDDHHNVEGADTYNACYGGTNALLNTVNWVQSRSWKDQYGVVVCSDPAVHPQMEGLAGIGASSISMLVGSSAPMVLRTGRVTYIKHSWDFYRPVGWHNNDALIDIDIATAQYEEAMLSCQQQFCEQSGSTNLLEEFDYLVYHCNAPYHAKRNLRLLCENTYGKLSREEHEGLYLQYVEPGTAISSQNGSTYTCPLYSCLLSLVVTKHEALVG